MDNRYNIHKNSLVVSQHRNNLLVTLFTVPVSLWGIVHMTLFPNDTATIWVYLLLISLLLSGLWYLWLFIIWKVTVEENHIRYRNCIAKTKIIPFEDIEKVKPKKLGNTLEAVLCSKEGKEVLTVPHHARNFDPFIKHLEQKLIKFE